MYAHILIFSTKDDTSIIKFMVYSKKRDLLLLINRSFYFAYIKNIKAINQEL